MKSFDIDFIVIYFLNEEENEYYCDLRFKQGKTNLVESDIALGHPFATGITLKDHLDVHFYNIY